MFRIPKKKKFFLWRKKKKFFLVAKKKKNFFWWRKKKNFFGIPRPLWRRPDVGMAQNGQRVVIFRGERGKVREKEG